MANYSLVGVPLFRTERNELVPLRDIFATEEINGRNQVSVLDRRFITGQLNTSQTSRGGTMSWINIWLAVPIGLYNQIGWNSFLTGIH